MNAWLIYLLILAAYAPGVWLTMRTPWFGKLPLLVGTFLGLFLLNAAGSILVLASGESEGGIALPAGHLGAMLIGQVAIFYVVVVPYAYLRRAVRYVFHIEPADYLAIPVLAIVAAIVVLAYLSAVGQSLLVDLLLGELDQYSAGELRQQKYYGLPFFQYYQLGLFVLPAITAAAAALIGLLRPSVRGRALVVIFLSFVPLILGGLKAGILELAVVLIMSYALYLGARAQPLTAMLSWRFVGLVLIALLPTIAVYALYLQGDAELGEIAGRFFYRVFGAYAESMAATAPFVEANGWLGGNSLPKVMGLVSEPADHVGIDEAMHLFLTGFTGAAPVPAVGEGYANFGWWGFVAFAILYFASVVAIQELLLLMRGGILVAATSAYFAYLAFKTSVLGIFATLLSPLSLVVLLLPLLMRVCARALCVRGTVPRPLQP